MFANVFGIAPHSVRLTLESPSTFLSDGLSAFLRQDINTETAPLLLLQDLRQHTAKSNSDPKVILRDHVLGQT